MRRFLFFVMIFTGVNVVCSTTLSHRAKVSSLSIVEGSEIEGQSDSIIRLKEVDVAIQRQKEFAESGKVVRTISAKEIALLPVQSLDALLESVPGIDVRQRSNGGTQADVSLRGGTFDQVLILLNGVNISDPQTGHHNLNIPLDFSEITKVEILQGAAARKYGNQAFSGAINIITDPHQKPKLTADIHYGSFQTSHQKLSFASGNEKIRQFTSVSNGMSEGYRTNTDYRLLNVYNHTAIQLKTAGKVDVQMSYQQKAYGAQGFYSLTYPNQFEQTKTMFGSAGWSLDKDKYAVSVKSYWRKHYDRFELFRNMDGALSWYTGHNYHLTDVYGASAQGSYYSNIGKFSAGLETRVEHIFSTALGVLMDEQQANVFEPNHPFTKEANRSMQTFFVDYTRNFGNLHLSAGGSTLYSNDFGWNTNLGGELSWQVSAPLNVYVSANSASRLPTFTDLYLVNSVQKGNPDLQAEKAMNYESGLKYNTSKWKADVSVFLRQGRNIIDWVRYIGMAKWESMNLSEVNTSGFELSAEYLVGKSWLKNVKTGYGYLHSDKQAVGYDSKYTLDNLKHHFNVKTESEPVKKWTMFWDFSFQDRAGNYIESGDIVVDYEPVYLMNHRSQYAFKNFVVYVDVNDILNQQVVDFGGLPLPGISVLGGIKFQLKD